MAETLNELIDQCRENAALAGLATSEQRSWDRMADKLTALSAALAAQDSLNIPDNWLPTSENINALPRPVRDYIMRLHANTDPAGELRRAMIAEMERDALRKILEWQPIDTATMDGTRILVSPPYDGIRTSHWEGGLWQGLPWSMARYEQLARPTHWMPLPEARSERG